jgi:hypothetical protein
MRAWRGRVSAEAMFSLSLDYLPFVTGRPGFEEARRRRKVPVEFIL